jgi:hypothetical protein
MRGRYRPSLHQSRWTVENKAGLGRSFFVARQQSQKSFFLAVCPVSAVRNMFGLREEVRNSMRPAG